MAKIRGTREEAMKAWCELAIGENCTMKTDFAVNEWLEEVAGKKYQAYEKLDDPIWQIIGNLTNSERRRFIAGCERIEMDVDEWIAARA